jgi:hypothetical protein
MARALRPSGLYVPVGLWLNTFGHRLDTLPLACGSTRWGVGLACSWRGRLSLRRLALVVRGIASGTCLALVVRGIAICSMHVSCRGPASWDSPWLLNPTGRGMLQCALSRRCAVCAQSGRAQASALQAREGVSSSPCVSSKSSGMPCKPREQRFCPAAAKVQPWCLRWCAWKRW